MPNSPEEDYVIEVETIYDLATGVADKVLGADVEIIEEHLKSKTCEKPDTGASQLYDPAVACRPFSLKDELLEIFNEPYKKVSDRP